MEAMRAPRAEFLLTLEEVRGQAERRDRRDSPGVVDLPARGS